MPTVSQIAQSTRHGKPPRLLLVEDDEVLRRTLLRLLIRKFAVTETKDAEEAISAMEQSTFDVILSDIGLPTISGVELLRRVRAHDLEVPVVLMTGQPSIETAIEAIELLAEAGLELLVGEGLGIELGGGGFLGGGFLRGGLAGGGHDGKWYRKERRCANLVRTGREPRAHEFRRPHPGCYQPQPFLK